jgi:hypothetical protein
VAVDDAGAIALAYRVLEGKRVRLALSTDAGRTWEVPTENLDPSGSAFAPTAAWGASGTLLVGWPAEGRPGGRPYEIHARRSPDGGTTFEPLLRMCQPAGSQADFSHTPHLIGDGKGRFWLVCIETRRLRSTLRLIRSEDNGRTWSPPLQLSGNGRAVFGPSIDRAGDRLLVTWQDERMGGSRPYRIYATSSQDGGLTWSPPVPVDGLPDASPINAIFPSSALAASGEALVAWQDNRNGRHDIFVARSADGGRTWYPTERVDVDPAGAAESRHPRVAISPDGRVAAVVWEDDRRGFEAIYGRLFVDGRWSSEARLGAPLPPKTAGRRPRIVPAGQDSFYVVWEVEDQSRGPARLSLNSVVIRPGS